MRIRRPHSGAIVCLLVIALSFSSASSEVTTAQSNASNTAAVTVSATTGSVALQPAGAADATQLGSEAQSTGWGDTLQVGDDGEAALNAGSALGVRVFHQSQARILGSSAPASDPAAAYLASLLPAGSQLPAYELLSGTTYNTASGDPASGSPVAAGTPGAIASSMQGTFLMYYDPFSTTTWVIVTDGTATVTTNGGTIDIPAGFATSVPDRGQPGNPQPANRATLGGALPSIDELTNSALADADVLAAPAPVAVDTSAGPATQPPDASSPTTAFAAGTGDTALAPALSNLGGLLPFPTTATLHAEQSTVWYWPLRQGDLDTVGQDGTRTVKAGDGVNVNEVGRAQLDFPDFNVQIFRKGQLQMIPTADANGYGLGYDLLQGATLNTISANALQGLTNDRVGVRAGWAVVTAAYTAHPAADAELVAQSAGRVSVGPGDTQFMVASDGSSSWVVVTQGTAQVEPVAAQPGSIPTGAPPAAPVLVSAGMQTWVDPGQAPVPPVPATRAAVGTKFPTLEDLSNGELTDAQVLAGSSTKAIQINAPVTIAPPTGQSQAPCYHFTSTPIGGATYAITMKYASLPAASVTYWNPPSNTWFYAKYASAQAALRPTVTISMNGTTVQTVQAADSLIDLSNGAKQSFINFHFIDSQLDTAVSLTGATDVIKSPVVGSSLPPLSAFTRTQFFYKPAGTGRVAAVSTC